MNWYSVKLKDDEGYDIAEQNEVTTNKKKAIIIAKDMLADPEYIDQGSVEVVDSAGEVVWDECT